MQHLRLSRTSIFFVCAWLLVHLGAQEVGMVPEEI